MQCTHEYYVEKQNAYPKELQHPSMHNNFTINVFSPEADSVELQYLHLMISAITRSGGIMDLLQDIKWTFKI